MSAKTVYLISGGPSVRPSQLTADLGTALGACGVSAPRVAYVGTASLDSRPFFASLSAAMRKAGAGAVTMAPVVGRHADLAEAQRVLTESDAVFLTGGEVEDGVSWLRKTGLDALLAELYEGGRQFFGISAGCIMMGKHWVHWDREDDDATASLFDCLGFLPLTFDAHGEREDWRELRCALRLMGPGAEGFGLSDGGFFTADVSGRLTALRRPAAAFRNADGTIVAPAAPGEG
jgi:peptidase E